MKTRIVYKNLELGPFVGLDAKDIAEAHLTEVKNVIAQEFGVVPVSLKQAYVEYDRTEHLAFLHIRVSDEMPEVIFSLPDLTGVDVPNRIELEISGEPHKSGSVDESSLPVILGQLEAHIDHLADTVSGRRPAETLAAQMGTLRNTKTQAYLARLMTLFGFLQYDRTGEHSNSETMIHNLLWKLRDLERMSDEESHTATTAYLATLAAFTNGEKPGIVPENESENNGAFL